MRNKKLIEKQKELILHYEKIIAKMICIHGYKPEQPLAGKIKSEIAALELEAKEQLKLVDNEIDLRDYH